MILLDFLLLCVKILKNQPKLLNMSKTVGLNNLEAKAENDEQPNWGLVFAVANPIWISVSEAAKLGGVQTKTIRRAIEGGQINFKTKNNRYLIELGSVLKFLSIRGKLKQKFLTKGLAQYFKL
jgi:hypothetical protein